MYSLYRKQYLRWSDVSAKGTARQNGVHVVQMTWHAQTYVCVAPSVKTMMTVNRLIALMTVMMTFENNYVDKSVHECIQT